MSAIDGLAGFLQLSDGLVEQAHFAEGDAEVVVRLGIFVRGGNIGFEVLSSVRRTFRRDRCLRLRRTEKTWRQEQEVSVAELGARSGWCYGSCGSDWRRWNWSSLHGARGNLCDGATGEATQRRSRPAD